jgi:hypothetical protein
MCAVMSLTGCGVSSLGGGEHAQKSFNAGGHALTIEADGDVALSPADGDDVTVDRWLSGDAADAGNNVWTLEDSTLRLSAKCGDQSINCGGRFEVAVPKSTKVTIQSGDSPVKVTGLSQNVTVRTSGGDINVRDSSGPLDLTTKTGVIKVNAGPDRLRLTTSGGDIDVTLTAVPDKLTASSVSGNVKVNAPSSGEYRVTVSSSTGSAKSKLPNNPGGVHVIDATSQAGDVDVRPS